MPAGLRHRPSRRLFAMLAVPALAGLGTSACSSGETGQAGAGEPAAATAPLDVEARDFAFAPSDLRAEPGSEVTVRLRNTGQAPHTFTIASAGVDLNVKPGESADARFTMPDQSVEFVCTLHLAQGMKGVVQSSGS